MFNIGITGGIGTGKTTVCKIFEILGIPVFYADQAAKQVMHEDELLVEEIKSAFGASAYSRAGELDRKYLAGIVFNDEFQLERLNSLVHPAVFRAYDKWKGVQKASYVIKEAALLFESGSYKESDYNVVVTSPLELRIKRIMKRDGISVEQVKARMSKQMSEEEKVKLADFIVKNDESELLIPQVLDLHQTFLQLSKQSQ